MDVSMDDFNSHGIFWMCAGSLLAGFLRGLAGFGGALVLVPIISIFQGPLVAIPVLNLIDIVTTLPLLPSAFRKCRWREVLPLCLGGCVTIPLGVILLTVLNPDATRCVMAILILATVILMAGGWRYSGVVSVPASVGVGGLSGLMSGAVGLSGPPVVLLWLGGNADSVTIRANVIAYFGMMNVTIILAILLNQMITEQVILLSLTMMPLYQIGIMVGARRFNFIPEHYFRPLAFTIIAAIAAISLIGSLSALR